MTQSNSCFAASSNMRFRLLNLVWILTIASICLAWYVDRSRQRPDDILGVWYSEAGPRKYWDTLTLNRDGTFSKAQRGMYLGEVYSGKYIITKNGAYLFHVTSKENDAGYSSTTIHNVDARFRCRLAIDHKGRLIVANLDRKANSGGVGIAFPETVDMDWRPCYSRLSHDQQVNLRMSQLGITTRSDEVEAPPTSQTSSNPEAIRRRKEFFDRLRRSPRFSSPTNELE